MRVDTDALPPAGALGPYGTSIVVQVCTDKPRVDQHWERPQGAEAPTPSSHLRVPAVGRCEGGTQPETVKSVAVVLAISTIYPITFPAISFISTDYLQISEKLSTLTWIRPVALHHANCASAPRASAGRLNIPHVIKLARTGGPPDP